MEEKSENTTYTYAYSNSNSFLSQVRMPSPIGYIEFCQRNCINKDLPFNRVKLTESLWQIIVKTNNKVNSRVTPVTDQDHWGKVEVWNYPDDNKGDCEDFVLEKQRLLVNQGFPINSVAITVFKDKKGDGHAVLTLRTDIGNFILDNMKSKIMQDTEPPYKF